MHKTTKRIILGLIYIFICITILSCEKRSTYSSSSNQVSNYLPEVAIIGCHLGDNIETVEGTLKEYGITIGEKKDAESIPANLKFLDVHCYTKDIPNDLTFGNLKVSGLYFRFWNEKLCQIRIYFTKPSKQDFEELCGAYKRKYAFPEKRTSYHGPKEFQYAFLMNWNISSYDMHKDEYDYYYAMCNKRNDGILYFDYWNDKTPQIGIFDSKQGSEMISYLKYKKLEGEKKKQTDLF